MIRLGLIGHPVAHSKSPEMHKAALELLGRTGRYDAIDVTADALEECISKCKKQGFTGLNVTVPHKVRAMSFCDEVDQNARSVGAVNTLVFRANGSIFGTNTDVQGFLACCPGDSESLSHHTALIVGAGGAARAVIAALQSVHCKEIIVTNRSTEKAESLASEFNLRVVPLQRDALETLNPTLVINATSMGMSAPMHTPKWDDATSFFAQLPFERWSKPHAIDLVYTPTQSAFLELANQGGCSGVNGLTMLAHQGALSLSHWIGEPIDKTVGAMRRALGLK